MDGDRVPLCGELGSRASEHTPVAAAAAGTSGRAEAEAEAARRRVLRELNLDRYAEGLQVHELLGRLGQGDATEAELRGAGMPELVARSSTARAMQLRAAAGQRQAEAAGATTPNPLAVTTAIETSPMLASGGAASADIEMVLPDPATSAATRGAPPSLEHIEDRGVSAAFLLHLLATKLGDERLTNDASATAVAFLKAKIESVEKDIEVAREWATEKRREAARTSPSPSPSPSPTGG
jgi:hypothetical protein